MSNGNGYAEYHTNQDDDEESIQAETITVPLNDTPLARKLDYRELFQEEDDEEQCPLMEPVITSRIPKRRVNKAWSKIKRVVLHNTTGGRGATLNYGAMHARGRILTFLHADTLLPADWDVHVESALLPSTSTSSQSSPQVVVEEELSSPPKRWRDVLRPMLWWKRMRRRRQEQKRDRSITTLCAFSFGIDSTRQGLDAKPCPPGLRGALWLGLFRMWVCKLPYGDSAPSMPAAYFHHIGGYPDQPLMEDYELVSLIRRRAQLLTNERMVILPVTATCSPRRWQRYGVSYTTLVNALCIWRYENGWTADDLFRFYYGR